MTLFFISPIVYVALTISCTWRIEKIERDLGEQQYQAGSEAGELSAWAGLEMSPDENRDLCAPVFSVEVEARVVSRHGL